MAKITHAEATFDVAVVGAGPIGIELAIALQRAGVDYVLIEANQIGHAISRWPPHTYFYSTPTTVMPATVPRAGQPPVPVAPTDQPTPAPMEVPATGEQQTTPAPADEQQ